MRWSTCSRAADIFDLAEDRLDDLLPQGVAGLAVLTAELGGHRQEPVVVQVGVDLGQLGGQPLGLLGQQRAPQRGLGLGLAQHRPPPASGSYNGVIQPQTQHRSLVFALLMSYFSRDFFRARS
jgi:hypothetical protein